MFIFVSVITIKRKTMDENIFVNGFTCWMETHYEVCCFIGYELKKSELLFVDNVITTTAANEGSGGLHSLAKKWADDFETLNKGREWDGEFYDEIYNFLVKHNKIQNDVNNI